MHRIVYVSHARDELPSNELFRIIEQSSRNNPGADITGFLVYRCGRFLQFIEGPLASLEGLLAVLAKDPRHHSLRVLSCEPVRERSFPRWRMKRIGETGDALAELTQACRAEGHAAPLPPAVNAFLQEPLAA